MTKDFKRLKAERTQLRRVFTTSANKLEELLKEGKRDDLWVKYAELTDKAERLFKVDATVDEILYDVITDEEELAAEVNQIESYRERWFGLVAKRELLLKPEVKDEDNASVDTESTVKLKKMYKLPKLELRKFDGAVKGWISFWASFKKVHTDETYDNAQKFDYLIQCMAEGTPAREFIDSFVPSAANYPKAIEALKRRFGRDELLIELYVRELLRLVLSQASSKSIALRSLYDQLATQLGALESLGVTKDKYACILLPLAESALPDGILRLWERSRVDLEATKQLDELLRFLQREVEGEERLIMAREAFGRLEVKGVTPEHHQEGYGSSSGNKLTPTAADLVNVEPRNKAAKTSCIFCDKTSHESSTCFTAMDMSIADIEQVLTRKRACFNCMRPNHRKSDCRLVVKCIVCQGRHLGLLCKERKRKESLAQKPTNSTNSGKDTTSTDQTLSNIGLPNVLMQTLSVVIRGKTDIRARLLIDTGSQRSYVTKRMINKMGYDPIREEQLIHALFGGAKSAPTVHQCFRIRVKNSTEDYACNFEALVTEVICHAVPVAAHGQWLNELRQKGIVLSDVEDGPIDILVGADIAGKLLTGRIEVLSGGLVAVQTRLGWTLMGKVNTETSTTCGTYLTMVCAEMAPSDLWKLDVLGIEDPAGNTSKQQRILRAKDHFSSTVKILDDGRYEVQLPWRSDHPPLRRHFDMAMLRLEHSQRKLRVSGTQKAYENVLHEWLREGIIEEVPIDEWDAGHYLPHRAVYKPGSTTPVRPVFDASARERGQPSLNQCLETGPTLIEQIPSVLLRFREGKIGLVSDVKKAFLQISLSEADRDYLRFVWKEENGQLRIFRHARVVFGVCSSPFLLGSVFEHHLGMCQQRIERGELKIPPAVVDHLRHRLYVDNYVGSLSFEAEVEPFIDHAKTIFAMACFDLRGWEQSNPNRSDYNDIPVLGLLWQPKSDMLKIRIPDFNDVNANSINKKMLLSIFQRLFDPIGLTTPVTVLPKRLFQKVCTEGGAWDKEVDGQTSEEMMKWISQVPALGGIQVNRWLENYDVRGATVTLHTFCDASQIAYAAVVFIRIEFQEKTSVHLVASKSRIAPSEQITIPRLELLAATVGARLSHNILKVLTKVSAAYYWTDSSTALTWIQREEPWAVFVGNRVNEIRLLSGKSNWRHIPGAFNPADIASRGCSPSTLVKQRWWEGPRWLQLPESQWPESQFEVCTEEAMVERKKVVLDAVSLPAPCITSEVLSKRFSEFHRIVNVMAWIFRFLFNKFSTTHKFSGPLSVPELNRAERFIFRIIQDESFSGERDPLLKRLKPQVDKDGLLRIRTKIWARKDAEDFRAPYILPSNHILVSMLILHVHLNNGHVVSQGLLNILRERYWILRGRQTIRRVLKSCVRCQRVAARALDAETPPLPEDRVRDAQVFEVCGTDLAGPLYLRNGDKVWICIFTCAIYRAIYLDLVASLSTESFMMAFRRFVARHGRPHIMYSDNGTNFHGLNNALNDIDWKRVQEISAVDRIDWRFNPPTAAWWGGFWERLIGLVKTCLKKILGRASLTHEELLTVVSECAAYVNSRPITFVSEDPDDPVPVTPQMFISDVRQTGLPDFDEIDNTSFEVRIKRRAETMDNLRVRFRSEYLGQLNMVAEGWKNSHKPRIGELVMIESSKRRYEWPLAIVEDIIPGTDGHSRVLKLRTADGSLTRPIQRVYPLEVPLFESFASLDEPEEKDASVDSSVEETDDVEEQEGLDVSPGGSDVDEEDGISPVGSAEPQRPETVLTPRLKTAPQRVQRVTTRCGRSVNLPTRFR